MPPDGYAREPAGCFHRGPEELLAFYDRRFFSGGGIELEYCAFVDDGSASALRVQPREVGQDGDGAGGGRRGLRAGGQRQDGGRADLRRCQPARVRSRAPARDLTGELAPSERDSAANTTTKERR